MAKTISAAGWEPLTHAATGNEKVYVARWGRGRDIYFTLFNDSDQSQEYTLTVDLKALGLRGSKGLAVLVGDKSADKPTITETLAPEDLRVFRLLP